MTASGTIMLLAILTVDNDTKPLPISSDDERNSALRSTALQRSRKMGEGTPLQGRSKAKWRPILHEVHKASVKAVTLTVPVILDESEARSVP